MLAGLVLFLGWLWFVWPPPAWYRWAWPRETAFMAMRRHQEEHLPASTGRTRPPVRLYQPVPLALMPPAMRTAALIGEDHRFYEHGGIDYEAIRDAMGYRRPDFRWASAGDRSELRRAVGSLWGRRSRIRGASTITQQLAKNLYLSPSRNPLRKLKEAVTAWRLEYWLGKNRILELYLNVVELGREVWGVEAASRKYFGHSASRLTLEEAGALAATLPFPLVSNPGFRPARMRWRQSMIVRRVRGEDVTVPRDTGEFADLVPDTVRVAPMDTLRDSLRIEPADTTKNTTRSRPRDTLERGSQGGGGR
jgi:monofunctional biosynthetic peptidoglycan transglycosylase